MRYGQYPLTSATSAFSQMAHVHPQGVMLSQHATSHDLGAAVAAGYKAAVSHASFWFSASHTRLSSAVQEPQSFAVSSGAM